MSRSVLRCLDLLHALATHDGLRFSDCAAAMPGAADSTVWRLLTALEAGGWVVHEGGRYHLGRAIVPPSPTLEALRRVQVPLDAIVRELAARTACPAAVMAREGERSLHIVSRTNVGRRPPGIRPAGTIMPLFPFHGFAQVLLAWSPSAIQRDSFHRLRGHAAQPPLGWRAFRERLRGIRESGHRIEDRDQYDHIGRICVPLQQGGRERPQAAVGIVGPTAIVARAGRLLPVIRQAAGRIAEVLERGH